MISPFINAYKLHRKSTASFHEEITQLRNFSYRERLSILNLDTLEYRRLSCDLTLYYKIFNNLTPWSPSEYFNVSQPPYSLHSLHHDLNIRKPMCRTISLIDVSLPGTIYRFTELHCQIKICRIV